MIRMFSRYLGVQLVAYAIDMGVFLALSSWLAITPIAANVVGKLAAGTFAFFMHRRLTFQVHGQGGGANQLLRYAVLLALNIPVASLLLAWLLPWLAPPALAKVGADAIRVVLTFLLSRHLVFTTPHKARPGR